MRSWTLLACVFAMLAIAFAELVTFTPAAEHQRIWVVMFWMMCCFISLLASWLRARRMAAKQTERPL